MVADRHGPILPEQAGSDAMGGGAAARRPGGAAARRGCEPTDDLGGPVQLHSPCGDGALGAGGPAQRLPWAPGAERNNPN